MGTWHDFTDERGLMFSYRIADGGNVEVQICRGDGYLMSSYVLTVDHVAWMYRDSQTEATRSVEAIRTAQTPNSDSGGHLTWR